MRFTRFGVTLERLERRHLERVRQWRNSDWVRPHMRHRAVVQPADQVRWFDNLDPRCDWYFCAHVEDAAPFALLHVKAVDWTRKSGEAGGFVGSPDFIGRPEAAQATLALMDFAFLLLNLESLEAQYRVALRKMVRFNEQLGYQVLHHEPDGFLRAHVRSDRYFACAHAFRHAAVSLHGTGAALSAADPWLVGHIAGARAPRPSDFQLQLP